ncbi:zinc finger CCHC domain-containing protein 14 isoform X2 [Hemicordylus capensis]|uniref:zinc finger CCHC domain-containing protein 14 isoform X2 n=1 Tax=Hemicordylus capensis TaxID=884348 RepID=UPI0023027B21|nr:zinc finger CCHC domain-containing protein 14 isoform X2 [Hemicordylus capensis]
MVEKRCPRLQRENVYRWFSELPSPQRVEFLCGLLDLCIPLELRFLGACLEDLARKDYHSLRDLEIKANNPADLGSLTNLTDEVVRSKLLVSLALLGSSHREAAGVLFRTLTHIDSVIHNYGLQLNEGRTGDEFLLLFTMASNHPAFSFHQKQVLRQELTKIQNIIASTSKNPNTPTASTMGTCPGCHKVTPRSETPINSIGNSLENALHTSAHSIEESLPKRPSGKHSKVSVEKVEIKGLSHKKNDRNTEYSFEVLWSDSSVTLVTKSSAEVTEFISKLCQLYPDENLEKFIPCLAGPDSFYLERNHMDLESDLRYLASLPSHVWKNDHVKKFFSTSSHSQQLQSSSPGNTSVYKVGTTLGASGRPICGVAGIQSSQNSLQHHMPHSAATPVALPHCSHSGGAGAALACRSQLDNSSPVLMTPSSQTPQAQEQNGILDWLRKLRLHKYYPVFKQLTMEKFLSLTEEDLNKFESLTMGAKKKLKTQLELEKEKSEKRILNPAMSPSVSSSGVARVPPTTHIGPIQSIRGNHAAELRVDVDQPTTTTPREGSSSEYSSSSSSPMGIQTREESSDSAEENERRAEIHLETSEKEKPVMILSHFNSSSARPTAQVLPVQNDAGSGPSSHHTLPVQMMAAGSPHIAPIRILNSMHKSERGNTDMKLLSSSMHSLLSLEDRTKFSPGPPRSSIKMEKSFGNTIVDGMPASAHQPMQVLSGVPENGSSTPSINFGPRTKMVHASTLDRVVKTAQQPGILVETSTTATVTSSTVFHVARPPLKLLVSSSVPTDSTIAGQPSCASNMPFSVSPAIISPRTALYTANTKVAFSAMSSMPVAPMPSNSFCANSNTASSSSHPSSTSFVNMASLPSCPAPSSSPTLSSAAENSFYNSSSSSGGGSAGSIPVPNQNHHHHHHHHHQQQQPPGCVVCSSCGCSGNCGSSGMTVSYANYFQHPFSGPSMFTFPFLPFNPLCSNGYINTQQYNSSSSAFPMVHSPYNGGLTPDSVMSGQSTFAVPPMQSFMAGTAGVYQAQGMMSSNSGTGHKKNGNLSCYNCGASGHRAQDCKQPPMDFNRQGTFRLKYAPPAESLDSTD